MADRYCSVRFKTGEELDKALAAALCSCDDAARAEAAAARAAEIQNKVDETVAEALTQAKESGEFDGPAGKDGADGYTPQKGVDYWTEADKAEIKAEVGGGITELPDSVPHTVERESYMTFAETPEHSFSSLGYTWWKVFDVVPTTEEILSGQFTGKFGSDPVTWNPTVAELMADTEAIAVMKSTAYGMGFAICRVAGEHTVNIMNADVTVNVPVTGVYFGYVEGQAVPTTYEVGVAYTELNKLDERLLPVEAVRDIVNEVINDALSGEY